MIGTHSTKSERLNTLVAALGTEPRRPRERSDGLSDIIPLGEDSACITAAGDNAAIITVVTTTEKGRRLLRAIARFYGIQPAGVDA